ncbi:hypothetical protein CO024_00540, partial [Candidatus Gracilibacteria bacterium CG_4_9_14_0_2_um_filter_38_7]
MANQALLDLIAKNYTGDAEGYEQDLLKQKDADVVETVVSVSEVTSSDISAEKAISSPEVVVAAQDTSSK